MSKHDASLSRRIQNLSLEVVGTSPTTKSERLVIALDFGTTYSGIAYAFPAQQDPRPQAILNWPGAGGLSRPKIPTLIRYDKNDATKFEWGASVGLHRDNIVGVKLLLDPKQSRPLYLPAQNVKRDLKNLPKSPAAVAGDFIGAMYRHAMKEISKKVLKSYLDMCTVEYVLSVPAVWSDAAKNATLQAAKLGGFHDVNIIKEPEAAGLYTSKSLGFTIKPKDNFVICDAGGGTVDLISYQIEEVSPTLQARELLPGSGSMAGSLGLNQRFADAVARLVGDDQWYTLKKSRAFLKADKEFEEIKKAFIGDEDEEYIINFPMANLEDDPENGLVASTWTMTCEDLGNIFEPLIVDILRLVKDQVEAVEKKQPQNGVTAIFLVGGFGSSQYLKQRVERRHPNIQVLQPDDAWAAIAKGAALSRIPQQVKITSTCATRHYGVQAWARYDPVVDAGQHTDIGRRGYLRARRMTWYIHIGDDIARDQKIRMHFCRHINDEFTNEDLIFEGKLFECGNEEAPIHKSSGESIGLNATFTADLSRVHRSHFQREIDHQGEPFYNVDYDLVLSVQSAVMKFALEIDGEEMGSVNVGFD